MSKIYIYSVIDEMTGNGVIGYALAADGTGLAAHYSSNETFLAFDMGITSKRQHVEYAKHYPDGYELVNYIGKSQDELNEDKDFIRAVTLNQQETYPDAPPSGQ